MKHESEYNTINGLAVGDDMDADAFNVVSGLDGKCRNVYLSLIGWTGNRQRPQDVSSLRERWMMGTRWDDCIIHIVFYTWYYKLCSIHFVPYSLHYTQGKIIVSYTLKETRLANHCARSLFKPISTSCEEWIAHVIIFVFMYSCIRLRNNFPCNIPFLHRFCSKRVWSSTPRKSLDCKSSFDDLLKFVLIFMYL